MINIEETTGKDKEAEGVLNALREMSSHAQQYFGDPLTVGYVPQVIARLPFYHVSPIAYYYLAEEVRLHLLWFRWKKLRVLVAMYDPKYGPKEPEVGCTILEPAIKEIAERAVRSHAVSMRIDRVTILEDYRRLLI